jgi:hypothetical protein
MAQVKTGERKQSTEFGTAAESKRVERERTLSALPEVDVGPPGHAVRVQWNAVSGATAVEVDSAAATVGPVLAVANAELPTSAVGGGPAREVSVPQGKKVLSLGLASLKWVHEVITEEGTEEVKSHFESQQKLQDEDLRLVVAAPDTRGEMAPLFAVPPIGPRGMLPSMFAGATYSGSVLGLPTLDARKIRLSLTEQLGLPPEEWAAAPMALGSAVTATLGTPSTDLKLAGPAGATLWEFPGEFPDGTPNAEVDLRVALQTALRGQLAAKQPLDVAFSLTGGAGSKAGFRFQVGGALVRAFPGIIRTELQGDAAPVVLPQPALAAEAPTSATADLSVQYEGIRILDAVNDAVPAAGSAKGVIVTDRVVARALPPAALGPLALARVGIIGRAPVECELSVQLVDMTTGAPGGPLGDPGVITLPPSNAIATQWVEMPESDTRRGPIGVAVRATKGRFLWASGAAPLVKLAVRDPSPGGRPLRLAGAQLIAMDKAAIHLPAKALPAGAFHSTAPALLSDLFLTVDLSDLRLRYRR